jgi:ring-1,2-phenylacetyl-CoA epoxidase subunit PaaD
VVTAHRGAAWDVAASVPDPELPMVTLADLGILRSVSDDDGTLTVTITPTYSGCPAMREIGLDLHHRLTQAGWASVHVRTSLAPPWSSDWITELGRSKLAAAGIAAPNPARPRSDGPIPLALTVRPRTVACPRCGSSDTQQTAVFSATACRALYRCGACDEPFDYVKEI